MTRILQKLLNTALLPSIETLLLTSQSPAAGPNQALPEGERENCAQSVACDTTYTIHHTEQMQINTKNNLHLGRNRIDTKLIP